MHKCVFDENRGLWHGLQGEYYLSCLALPPVIKKVYWLFVVISPIINHVIQNKRFRKGAEKICRQKQSSQKRKLLKPH